MAANANDDEQAKTAKTQTRNDAESVAIGRKNKY